MTVFRMAGLALLASCLAMPAMAAPKRLDLGSPADAIAANRKMQCSRVDGEAVVYHWMGEVYSRVEGEPDRQSVQPAGHECPPVRYRHRPGQG